MSLSPYEKYTNLYVNVLAAMLDDVTAAEFPPKTYEIGFRRPVLIREPTTLLTAQEAFDR